MTYTSVHLEKRCSAVVIFEDASTRGCDLNKVAKRLCWDHVSAWLFSCGFVLCLQSIFHSFWAHTVFNLFFLTNYTFELYLLYPIKELHSHYAFLQIFTIGGASWTLDPSMEVVNCKVKQQVYFSCCLTLLATKISYELKSSNYQCRNLNHRNLLFLIEFRFCSPDLYF